MDSEVYGVIVEESSLVKPAALGCHGHGECVYLSSLDLFWREAPYTRRLLFYDIHGLLRQDDMLSKLRRSLPLVLSAFYPAAGRLIVGPSGRPSILCGGQGVQFLVARVNSPLSRLACSHFQPCSSFDSLAPPSFHSKTLDPFIPLLAFQITKFVCGGLALGISCSKVLADGHSIWHLMNSWAECARNEAISIPPFHNREVFKVDTPSNELASRFILPSCKTPIYEEVAPSLVLKWLHFSSEVIYQMKQEAYDFKNASIKPTFSDYDVLCAQMWRSIAASQTHLKPKDESTIIGVLGDMRFRMRPQLPRGYFGNATIFAFASSLVRDTESEAFQVIAQKIHEACKACNESRLWAMVNWLELHGNMFDKNCLPWMVTCLNVVSSPKFKVYGVDFGCGKPVAVRSIHVHNTRDMVLFPGYKDGIDVCLSLPNL